ncbi:transposase [Nonomuraea spiralis]|uniref:transposase n=1 Tax=Nonomuraea spiralis TaxID=46182 RepID=UPI0037B6963A
MRPTLLRNREDLQSDRFAAIWNTFLDAGVHGQDVLAAWIAKEELRALFTAICASQVRDRLHAFVSWCATHDHMPELVTLAETISRWREEIAAAIILKVSNAKTEGPTGHQAGPSHRLRLPQPGQPAPTLPLRHHPHHPTSTTKSDQTKITFRDRVRT